jgi:hypothetical protein
VTQNDRALRMMYQRGGLGITPIDFAAPNVIDGGAPIMRLARCVNDLRNQGHNIKTFKDGKVARYVLVPHVEVFEGPVLTTPDEAPVVGVTAGVVGPEWSTESPAVTAPVSGRAPESSPEDYIDQEELLWV